MNKIISIVVPCYNEEKTINNLYNLFTKLFLCDSILHNYDYEIIFADDYSQDRTRSIIKDICSKDKRVKGIFNMANFGFSRNIFSALSLASGNAVFLVFGDMQDPPELLSEFVKKWEKGSKVVIGRKVDSEEGKLISLYRKAYYKFISFLSEKPQIEEFNGYGLYDRKFIEVIKQIDDIEPYLKTVVSEYAPDYDVVEYHHRKSGRGKSNFNFYRNYDFAMAGVTTSTKKLMRLSTLLGVLLGVASVINAVYVLVRKIIDSTAYQPGLASIMVGVFVIGAANLFFVGILGEYMLSVNTRTMHKPRVVVDEMINFKNDN